MPSVLITGATGFIGSFLAEEGLRRGFDVYAAVRSTSSRKWLQDDRIRFLDLDTRSFTGIASSLEEYKSSRLHFDYIIHNAGIVRANKKGDFGRVNRDMTINFINALRQSGMVPRKFIYMSSLAAWGPGNPATMEPVRLTDPPNPAGLYGRSKLEAEDFIRAQSDLPYIILRPTGVYGPRETEYFTMYRTISQGFEPYLGSRDQVLTFIYVKDLARAAYDAMISSVTGRSYFVSDGKEYTAGEFAGIVRAVLEKRTVSIVFPLSVVKLLALVMEKVYGLWGSMPLLNSDKYFILSSRNWKCDPQPLFSDLSFTPEYDLRKGLEETLGWCREHKLL